MVIFRIIPTNTVINALGQARILAIIGLLELVIHLLLSYLGLIWLGLIGIAYATFFAYFFEKLLGLCYLWWKKGVFITHLIPFIGGYFIPHF